MPLRYVSAVCLSLFFLSPAAAQTPATSRQYVWAAACKDCHSGHYAAWEATKHARAIERLVGANREAGSICVQCHVTGPAPLAAGNVNANVQCESCHGPGSEHVQAARAGADSKGTIVRQPGESSCVTCHNEKSPHFKFFLYKALVGMVHKVRPS